MKKHQIRRVLFAFAISTASIISFAISFNASAQSLDEVFGVREATTSEGKRSQLKIDSLNNDTRDLLTQFKQTMKVVDGLRVYNQQQERLIRHQVKEMAELNDSIDNVTEVERQITPLIERMIDNLEKFIDLDSPFLITERRERIDFLRETLDRPDVSVSEKFSQVMQAYQVENSYGSTIEAYTDQLPINGQNRVVDVLKWGRISLVYQTPDGEEFGAWNQKTRSWEPLDDEFSSGIRNGMRIARKTQTADLVHLPITAPVGEQE